jgi:hypothetical protein
MAEEQLRQTFAALRAPGDEATTKRALLGALRAKILDARANLPLLRYMLPGIVDLAVHWLQSFRRN